MAEAARDFLLDSTGDLAVVNGDFGIAAGKDAVPQGIAVRVKMFLGECFLDEDLGVDWINSILIKGANSQLVRLLVATAIEDTPDVVDVVGAQVQLLANRRASISYKVGTIYSTDTIPGQVSL